jgi:hypothetical protein
LTAPWLSVPETAPTRTDTIMPREPASKPFDPVAFAEWLFFMIKTLSCLATRKGLRLKTSSDGMKMGKLNLQRIDWLLLLGVAFAASLLTAVATSGVSFAEIASGW